MDLALAIGGCTVAELEQRMTEREFNLWRRYGAQRGLPSRRLELGQAQISLLIARTMGNAKGNIGLRDFLFDPPAQEPEPDAAVVSGVMSAMTSARVRMLGQGRKNKGVH